LGYFIVSMRKADGGFYHSFDPHFKGTVDPDYFVIYFPGESLYALLQLHEMTGNEFWLKQAREVNDYMITQPVTEDHWHSYAFSMLARLDGLGKADQAYANQIANTIIAGQVRSLDPQNTAFRPPQRWKRSQRLRRRFIFQKPSTNGSTARSARLLSLSARGNCRTITAILISRTRWN
jgi:hypothetical protein